LNLTPLPKQKKLIIQTALIVKKTEKSPPEEATAIRKAFQPLRHSVANLAFDIMVRDPEDLRERIAKGGAFHSAIIRNGIRLA